MRGTGGREARGSGQIKSAGSAQFRGHKTVALSGWEVKGGVVFRLCGWVDAG